MKLEIKKPASIFAHPIMGADITDGSLQTRVNSITPDTHIMRGDPKVLKSLAGTAEYQSARDVAKDYERTTGFMAEHYAAPVNYENLRFGLFCTLHDYMSDGDRKKAEALISQMPPISGVGSGKTAIESYKENIALLKASPEETAMAAKVMIDVFNETSKKRHAFAKEHGLLEEFGFMQPETGPDGKPTGKRKDSGPVKIEAPAALAKEIKAYQAITAKQMVEVSVGDDGKQQMKTKARKGAWGEIKDATIGILMSSNQPVEVAVCGMAGALLRRGIMAIARGAGITNRVGHDAKNVSVLDAEKAIAIRHQLAGLTEARPEMPKDPAALAGATPFAMNRRAAEGAKAI